MIVLDASALVELLLQTVIGGSLGDRLAAGNNALQAPHLIDIEVAQVIRRLVRSHEVAPARGRVALTDLAEFPLDRHPHDLLLPRIWALRDNLTAYDASYVALAEALDAPLLTRDRRLAGSTGHRARIDLV